MKISKYENFISQNVVLHGTAKIGVYDSKGKRVGWFLPQNLRLPRLGDKLYSFGALSDIHLQYDTAQADFQKALIYLNNTEDVAFTCICGDLVNYNTDEHMATYRNYVDTYSPNKQVYAVAGNHESFDSDWNALSDDEVTRLFETYTGNSMWYSFTQGDDVFIMVGNFGIVEGTLFQREELQWLYETLEENRNKRCFVFQHIRPQDGCGNAYGIYATDMWGGTEATVFESLMSHYKNAHLFHGHSHLKLNLQTKDNLANIDRLFGGWSIHIPSLAVPRSGDPSGASSRVEIYAESEGYVVDVYKNHIVLRGRDFVKDKFIPLGTYCLDTKLVEIEANTFVDSTGTITT